MRRVTRERLSAMKGSATFDATVAALLDAAPPSLVIAQEAPRRGPPPRMEPADRRTPDKQVLLRALAREAWQKRLTSGEIREVGPRLLDWSPPRKRAAKGVARVGWPERRGFDP